MAQSSSNLTYNQYYPHSNHHVPSSSSSSTVTFQTPYPSRYNSTLSSSAPTPSTHNAYNYTPSFHNNNAGYGVNARQYSTPLTQFSSPYLVPPQDTNTNTVNHYPPPYSQHHHIQHTNGYHDLHQYSNHDRQRT